MVVELGKLGDQIQKAKIDAIPEHMKIEHYALRGRKEELELQRNKIGLKVQKVKDKVRPMIQKACKPHLEDDFEDLETAKLAGNTVIVKKFSHLESFKKSFILNNKK